MLEKFNRFASEFMVYLNVVSLIVMIHQDKYAEFLGDRKVQPVLDLEVLARLNIARKAFRDKLDGEGKVPLGL